MKAQPRTELALLVDSAGALTVMHDPAKLVRPDTTSLEALIDSRSRQKLELFMAEAKKLGHAYAWEMPVVFRQQIQTLIFSATGDSQGKLLVLAYTGSGSLPRVIDELLRAQPERAEELRTQLAPLAAYQVRQVTNTETPDPIAGVAEVNRELATMHRAMAQRNAELEQLQKDKNELLSTVAHDLRGPLSNLVSVEELLKSLLPKPIAENINALLQLSQETHQHMLAVIDSLLDLSALDAGRLELQAASLDLAEVLGESLRLQTISAQTKSISLSEQIVQPLWIKGDRRLLRQVIDNLIGNAIKFSEPETRVSVRAWSEKGFAWFEVADEGPGIPQAEQSELFKPFGRGSSQPTGGERSAGLGLAISLRVIQAHNGQIVLDSAPGRGSRFRVCLPADMRH